MTRIKGIVVKTTAPTVADDSTKGFYRGFKWVNGTTGIIYESSSVAVGAAVWDISSKPSSGLWTPPPASIGETFVVGVPFFLNSAGVRGVFDAESDNMIITNYELGHNGITYDGSNMALKLYSQLTVAPAAGNNVKWAVDYAFVKADATENAESKSTSFEDTIDVSARTAGLLYEDELSTMSGVVGAKNFQITITRNSSGGGSDTYPSSIGLYGFELIKK